MRAKRTSLILWVPWRNLKIHLVRHLMEAEGEAAVKVAGPLLARAEAPLEGAAVAEAEVARAAQAKALAVSRRTYCATRPLPL
jgi:uncharacterized protein YciI